MPIAKLFRSVFVCCSAIVMVSMVRAEAQLAEPLFDQISQSTPLAPPDAPRPPSAATRSRTVALRVPTMERALAAPATNTFTLNLFDDAEYAVQFERLEDSGHGQRSWVGRIANRPLSTVVLTLNGDIVSGRVADDELLFTIESVGRGLHRVEQLDPTAMPQIGDDVVEVPASAFSEPAPLPDRSSAAATAGVDILVFYSTGVRIQSGGDAQVRARVARYFAETNTAFARSGVAGQIRLVAALEVPVPDGANAAALLDLVRTHPTSAGYRELAGADLVALLVTHFDGQPVPLCGLAYVGPVSAYGYSLTATGGACDSVYPFTHEVGHNLGAQHATEDGVNVGPQYPEYARGYKAPDFTFRTVMAYECTAGVYCPPILNFSNPGITEGGRPTGTAFQFNARRVFEVMGPVAGYRVARVAPSAPHSLQGSASGATATLAWGLPIAGGSPADYLLEVGTAPGLSNLIAGLSVADTSLVATGVPPGVYYVRVRARNLGGVSAPSNEIAIAVR
jgi:Metallo-peptidase family M12B Reprolysin-like